METTIVMTILRRLTRSHWFWFGLGIAVVGVTAASIFSSGESSPPRAWIEPADSQRAPNFTLDRLNGDSFRLKEHRGEVVILNFWATWCPPCREEIPDFVSLQEDLGDQGVQFVGVALERNPDPQAVRDFAEKMNINYPVGLDDGSISQKYGGIRGLPTTFVIGPEGEIRGRIPGRTTEEMLRPALEKLLEETS
jgi:cytochrome c biogenesis protein CcmG/thiol:disulfide interchange protein DsbE